MSVIIVTLVGRVAGEEAEHDAEHEEVANAIPIRKSSVLEHDDRQREPLLVLVEARRDERPRLLEHVRQRDAGTPPSASP